MVDTWRVFIIFFSIPFYINGSIIERFDFLFFLLKKKFTKIKPTPSEIIIFIIFVPHYQVYQCHSKTNFRPRNLNSALWSQEQKRI